MLNLRKALLAGAAAIAIGSSGAALAQSSNTHVMTVRMPAGDVAEIRYTGDVAPQVVVRNGPAAFVDTPALMPSLFGAQSPFAMLDRISAEMDRQAAAMFREAETVTAQARTGQPIEIAWPGGLPRGSQGYSYISTMTGNGVCTQSVEITSTGNGPPRVVSHSSGNCTAAGAGPTGSAGRSINLPTAPAPAKQPDLLLTSADKPYRGMVRQVANVAR